MDRLAVPFGSKFESKWGWVLAAAIVVAVFLILLALFPGVIAVFQLYWSPANIERLFHEELGTSLAWSKFYSVVGSFIYALAWVPLAFWTFRLLAWRYSNRQLAVAFCCWVVIYGHAPLLHALLGSDSCFNQRTGAPLKWYVEDSVGRITLFDNGGFDTITRAEKKPVTPEVCASVARQKLSTAPQRVTLNVREIQFFDTASGRARIWYFKASQGNFELFNTNGFHPRTGEPLLPVTKDIVVQIMALVDASDAAQKRAEQAEAQSHTDDARQRVAVPQTKCPDGYRWANATLGCLSNTKSPSNQAEADLLNQLAHKYLLQRDSCRGRGVAWSYQRGECVETLTEMDGTRDKNGRCLGLNETFVSSLGRCVASLVHCDVGYYNTGRSCVPAN